MNRLQQEIALKQLMIHMPQEFAPIFQYLEKWEQEYVKKESLSDPKYSQYSLTMGWFNEINEDYLSKIIKYDFDILNSRLYKQKEIVYYDDPQSQYYKNTVIWYVDNENPLVLNDAMILMLSKIKIEYLYLHSVVIKNKMSNALFESGFMNNKPAPIRYDSVKIKEKTYDQNIQSVANLIIKNNYLMVHYSYYNSRIKKILRNHIIPFVRTNRKMAKEMKIDLENFSNYNDIIDILLMTENYSEISKLYNSNGKDPINMHISKKMEDFSSYPLSMLGLHTKVDQNCFDKSLIKTESLRMFTNFPKSVNRRQAFIHYEENSTFKILKSEERNNSGVSFDITKNYQVNYDALKMNYDEIKEILIKNKIWNSKNEAKLIDLFSKIIGLEKLKINTSVDTWKELMILNPKYILKVTPEILKSNSTLFETVMNFHPISEIRIFESIKKKPWGIKKERKNKIYSEYYPLLIDTFYDNKRFVKYLIDSCVQNAFFFLRYPTFNIEEYELKRGILYVYKELIDLAKNKKYNLDIKNINQALVDQYPNQIRELDGNEDFSTIPGLNHNPSFINYMPLDKRQDIMDKFINETISSQTILEEDRLDVLVQLNSYNDIEKHIKPSSKYFTLLKKHRFIKSVQDSKDHNEKYLKFFTEEMRYYFFKMDLLHVGTDRYVYQDISSAQKVIDEYSNSENIQLEKCLFMIGRFQWIHADTIYRFIKTIGSQSEEALKLLKKHRNFNPLTISLRLLED